MSPICQTFIQNAWRKDLCSNCFKSEEDHVPLKANCEHDFRMKYMNDSTTGSSRYIGVGGGNLYLKRAYGTTNPSIFDINSDNSSSLKSPGLIRGMDNIIKQENARNRCKIDSPVLEKDKPEILNLNVPKDSWILGEIIRNTEEPRPIERSKKIESNNNGNLGSYEANKYSTSLKSTSEILERDDRYNNCQIDENDTISYKHSNGPKEILVQGILKSSRSSSYNSSYEKVSVCFTDANEIIGYGGDIDYSDEDESDVDSDNELDSDNESVSSVDYESMYLGYLTEKNTDFNSDNSNLKEDRLPKYKCKILSKKDFLASIKSPHGVSVVKNTQIDDYGPQDLKIKIKRSHPVLGSKPLIKQTSILNEDTFSSSAIYEKSNDRLIPMMGIKPKFVSREHEMKEIDSCENMCSNAKLSSDHNSNSKITSIDDISFKSNYSSNNKYDKPSSVKVTSIDDVLSVKKNECSEQNKMFNNSGPKESIVNDAEQVPIQSFLHNKANISDKTSLRNTKPSDSEKPIENAIEIIRNQRKSEHDTFINKNREQLPTIDCTNKNTKINETHSTKLKNTNSIALDNDIDGNCKNGQNWSAYDCNRNYTFQNDKKKLERNGLSNGAMSTLQRRSSFMESQLNGSLYSVESPTKEISVEHSLINGKEESMLNKNVSRNMPREENGVHSVLKQDINTQNGGYNGAHEFKPDKIEARWNGNQYHKNERESELEDKLINESKPESFEPVICHNNKNEEQHQHDIESANKNMYGTGTNKRNEIDTSASLSTFGTNKIVESTPNSSFLHSGAVQPPTFTPKIEKESQNFSDEIQSLSDKPRFTADTQKSSPDTLTTLKESNPLKDSVNLNPIHTKEKINNSISKNNTSSEIKNSDVQAKNHQIESSSFNNSISKNNTSSETNISSVQAKNHKIGTLSFSNSISKNNINSEINNFNVQTKNNKIETSDFNKSMNKKSNSCETNNSNNVQAKNHKHEILSFSNSISKNTTNSETNNSNVQSKNNKIETRSPDKPIACIKNYVIPQPNSKVVENINSRPLYVGKVVATSDSITTSNSSPVSSVKTTETCNSNILQEANNALRRDERIPPNDHQLPDSVLKENDNTCKKVNGLSSFEESRKFLSNSLSFHKTPVPQLETTDHNFNSIKNNCEILKQNQNICNDTVDSTDNCDINGEEHLYNCQYEAQDMDSYSSFTDDYDDDVGEDEINDNNESFCEFQNQNQIQTSPHQPYLVNSSLGNAYGQINFSTTDLRAVSCEQDGQNRWCVEKEAAVRSHSVPRSSTIKIHSSLTTGKGLRSSSPPASNRKSTRSSIFSSHSERGRDRTKSSHSVLFLRKLLKFGSANKFSPFSSREEKNAKHLEREMYREARKKELQIIHPLDYNTAGVQVISRPERPAPPVDLGGHMDPHLQEALQKHQLPSPDATKGKDLQTLLSNTEHLDQPKSKKKKSSFRNMSKKNSFLKKCKSAPENFEIRIPGTNTLPLLVLYIKNTYELLTKGKDLQSLLSNTDHLDQPKSKKKKSSFRNMSKKNSFLKKKVQVDHSPDLITAQSTSCLRSPDSQNCTDSTDRANQIRETKEGSMPDPIHTASYTNGIRNKNSVNMNSNVHLGFNSEGRPKPPPPPRKTSLESFNSQVSTKALSQNAVSKATLNKRRHSSIESNHLNQLWNGAVNMNDGDASSNSSSSSANPCKLSSSSRIASISTNGLLNESPTNDTMYANIGNVRASFTPRKPGRTRSTKDDDRERRQAPRPPFRD